MIPERPGFSTTEESFFPDPLSLQSVYYLTEEPDAVEKENWNKSRWSDVMVVAGAALLAVGLCLISVGVIVCACRKRRQTIRAKGDGIYKPLTTDL